MWTHAEYVAESVPVGQPLPRTGSGTPDGALHVAVLLDNTPEYLFAFGGAALSGAAVVGLNHTRRGEHLLRDIEHTALRAGRHRAAPPRAARADRSTVCRRVLGYWPTTIARRRGLAGSCRRRRPRPRARCRHAWALIFTSGTSAAPEGGDLLATPAARHRQPHGDDHGPRPGRHRLRVHAAVPLERGDGRLGAVARGRRVGRARPAGSPRRGWLPDVRRYGATYFNYTGKPLAYLARHARAARRRRQPAARRVRQRGLARGRRRVRPALRRRGDRRVRRDRRRHRRQPRTTTCRPARSGMRGRRREGRRRGRRREAACRVRRRRPAARTPTSASARS